MNNWTGLPRAVYANFDKMPVSLFFSETAGLNFCWNKRNFFSEQVLINGIDNETGFWNFWHFF